VLAIRELHDLEEAAMPTADHAADHVRDDLRYVRRALEGARAGGTPASIYLLWAVIGACGLPLVDFAPRWAGPYWLVASPLGLVASLLLGRAHARRVGQLDRGEGLRHGLHWLALPLAAALAVPLAASGRLSYGALGQVILLLIAVVYFLAGVHLDRRLLPVALLLAAGYGLLFVLAAWAWTVVGLTTAAALAACAWVARQPHGETAG
jgi:hypothetical protein